MIKIASCELCGRYYRTGKIRQVIEKALGEENKFKEWRKAVCNGCYDSIILGRGVLPVTIPDVGWEESIDGDTLGYEVAKLSESVEGKGRKKILEESKPKEKKIRKRKNKITDSPIYKALVHGGELAPDDEDTDKKEPKKRGRKPRTPTGGDPSINIHPVESVSKFDQAFPTPEMIENDVVIPTSMPSLKDSEPVEEEAEPISSKDRNYYKNKVREALASKATITYEEIAKKLGIDEGLVGQLAGELDIE